jgi:hypothetical protein
MTAIDQLAQERPADSSSRSRKKDMHQMPPLLDPDKPPIASHRLSASSLSPKRGE